MDERNEILKKAESLIKAYAGEDVDRVLPFADFAYDAILERYKLVAHRSFPREYTTLFLRLIAFYAILDSRGVDAFDALKGTDSEGGVAQTTGAVRSISIGDSSTTFASSSGTNLGDGGADGAIDQNNELMRAFKRYWHELIANTRRLV